MGPGPGGLPRTEQGKSLPPLHTFMGEAEEGVQGPHTNPEGSCLHNHWDQCLIYVETAEIFTFLEPALPQLPPGLNTPGSELVSGLEAPRRGLGKLDPTLQATSPSPRRGP